MFVGVSSSTGLLSASLLRLTRWYGKDAGARRDLDNVRPISVATVPR